LPTSLTYIVLWARGCSPRRPAAVMSTNGRENQSLPRVFKGRRPRTGLYKKCRALPVVRPYLLANRFHGRYCSRLLTRKENSSRSDRRRPRVPLRYRTREQAEARTRYPRSGSGILTRFPFALRVPRKHHFLTEFPCGLGSTNPCPTAVHLEPFSTSAFKVLI
jgi:hypothetical protein